MAEIGASESMARPMLFYSEPHQSQPVVENVGYCSCAISGEPQAFSIMVQIVQQD